MLNDIWTRVRALLRRGTMDHELDEEMRFHFEQQVKKFVAKGMTHEEARRRAKLDFGGVEQIKEDCREARGVSFVESLAQDVRFGARMLRKSPGFTAVALLTLALGIGANTAIFSVVNAVMLRTLPVERPGELYSFGSARWVGSTSDLPDKSWQLFSYPFYREISQQNEVFSGVSAIGSIEFGTHGTAAGGPFELLRADLVSGNYFSVLGVKPVLGRLLTDADDRTPGAGRVAVASYSWWNRRFGRDPAVLGKTVRFESTLYTIVGVAPAEFFGSNVGESPELWIPLSMEKEISPGWNGLDNKFFQSLYLIARLNSGVTPEAASTNTNLRFKQILRAEYVGAQPSQKELDAIEHARIDLTPMSRGLSQVRSQFSLSLKILMAVVGLVLLIACVNIANLLLARGTARSREIAMRMAMGASRLRLLRQLATESLLLATMGAALGLLLSWQTPGILLAMASGSSEAILLNVAPDVRVFSFTLLLTLLASLLFGVAPALRTTKVQLTTAFQDGRSSSSATRSLLSKSLLISQIALSLMLLTGTGLFVRSLINLSRVDTGFDTQNVLNFDLDEYADGYLPDARLASTMEEIEDRVRSLPGVRAAGFAMFTFNQGQWSDSVVVEGIPRTPENSAEVLMNRVSAGFLDAMGLPILVGRPFGPADNAHSPKVALINETMARRFFPGSLPSATDSASATTRRTAANTKSSESSRTRSICAWTKSNSPRPIRFPPRTSLTCPTSSCDIRGMNARPSPQSGRLSVKWQAIYRLAVSPHSRRKSKIPLRHGGWSRSSQPSSGRWRCSWFASACTV